VVVVAVAVVVDDHDDPFNKNYVHSTCVVHNTMLYRM
jgi:hypothetical protein